MPYHLRGTTGRTHHAPQQPKYGDREKNTVTGERKGERRKKKRKLRKKKRGANSPKNVTINTPSLITQQAARARRSDTGNAKTKTKQKPAVICFFALALSPYIFPFHLFISLFLYLFTLVYSIFIFILHFKDQLLRAPSVGKHNSCLLYTSPSPRD